MDEKNDLNNEEDNEEKENSDNDNNNNNEIAKEEGEFDSSKYNVVSLDNMKNEDNNIEDKNNDNKVVEEKKDIICVICQRKFNSLEKLALHEKISELHKNNLMKLNSAKNN